MRWGRLSSLLTSSHFRRVTVGARSTGFSKSQVYITVRFLAPSVVMLAMVLAAVRLGEDEERRTRWLGLFTAAIAYGTGAVLLTHAVPSLFQWP